MLLVLANISGMWLYCCVFLCDAYFNRSKFILEIIYQFESLMIGFQGIIRHLCLTVLISRDANLYQFLLNLIVSNLFEKTEFLGGH